MNSHSATFASPPAVLSDAASGEAARLPWYGSLLFSRGLRALYARCQLRTEVPLVTAVLRELDVRYEVRPAELTHIPKEGPALVVANHPFGLLDGALVADLVGSLRPDVKVLTNYLVAQLPELREHCIPLDPWGGKTAARFNRRGLRQARQWLQQGGVLVSFPAGEVSTWHGGQGVSDGAWTHTASRLARAAHAPLVPVFVDGSNSRLFHGLGLVHPALRTLSLPRELLAKRGACVAVRVGRPLHPQSLHDLDDAALTEAARAKTYMLAHGLRRSPVARAPIHGAAGSGPRWHSPDSGTCLDFADEFEALPGAAILHEDESFRVAVARYDAIPAVMAEVGRQRELTFRAVGEGTGKTRDLDAHDPLYEHLILWHKGRREVAGGYRVGQVQALLKAHGPSGLYTASLYHFDASFFADLPPALELGRSFICPAYQRQYGSLLALWKGLAQYVAGHPQTPVLMGPVSVSQRYHAASRQLMAEYFTQRCVHPLRHRVGPRCALRSSPAEARMARTLAAALPDWGELSSTIAELEVCGKGLPVLMRQYLKLGAQLLAFSVDPAFGNCLDGLVLLDLRESAPRLLRRFMGEAGYDAFARHHALRCEATPSR